MSEREWSSSEKKIARRAYDAALDARLVRVMAEMKAKAAQAATLDEMWGVEDFLREQRREINDIFDYR